MKNLWVRRLLVSKEGTVIRPSALVGNDIPYDYILKKDCPKRATPKDRMTQDPATPQLLLSSQLLRSLNEPIGNPKDDDPSVVEPMDTVDPPAEEPILLRAQPSGGGSNPNGNVPDTWVQDTRKKYSNADTSLLHFDNPPTNYLLESYQYRENFAREACKRVEKGRANEIRCIIEVEAELFDIATVHVSGVANLSSNLSLK